MGGGQIKGFTLIEILGVITLLALISTIVIIVVNKSLKEAKETLYKSQLENIRSAANMWRTDNIEHIPDEGYYTIILKKLIDNNYIDENIENPKTKEPFDKNTVIRISMKDIKIGEEQLLKLVSSGDGLYASELDEDRYIYKGANPDNYLTLKENDVDTLYRIISYESDGTIKVLRNNRIVNPEDISSYTIPWDNLGNRTPDNYNTFCLNGSTLGCNAWGNQDNTKINGKLLDTNFYYKYYANSETLTFSQNGVNVEVIKDSSLNKYLNITWLDSIYISEYIASHDFKVGGLNYYSNYTGGDKGKEKEKAEESTSTWNGKVALINITDFVDTSINPSCTSVYSNYAANPLYYYKDNEEDEDKTTHIPSGGWPCTVENWLFRGFSEWTISAYSGSRNIVWNVSSNGVFNRNNANRSIGARPVFFLKPTITLKGKGTKENPFEIIN